MKKALVTIAALLLLMACGKDNDTPDPRMAFVGEYKSNEYEMLVVGRSNGSVTGDSLIIVNGGTLLKISLSPATHDDLEVDIEEVVDDAITTLFSTGAGGSVVVNFEDDLIAQTDENEFEFESVPFEVSRTGWTAPASVTGRGKISGNTLSLEYQIAIILDDVVGLPESGFSLSGEMELTKQ